MSEIRIEKDDVIATVIISNPRKRNAINVTMWNALERAFSVLSQDESLRCVMVRGDQQNFSAGADIEEFSTVRSTMAQGIRYHTETIGKALQAISQCQHPTVAAIEGVCIGGGLEIACACDLRIAAPDARFGIPINRLGFSLAPDEMRYFLQLVGKANLLEIRVRRGRSEGQGAAYPYSGRYPNRSTPHCATHCTGRTSVCAHAQKNNPPHLAGAGTPDDAGIAGCVRLPRISRLS